MLTAYVSATAQPPELTLEQFPDQPAPTKEKIEMSEFDTPEATPARSEKSRKPHKWNFGITAGYRHSGNNWLVDASGILYNYKENTRTSPGFTVGGTASLKIDEVLSFDTGLNLALWGFGYQTSDILMKFSRYVLEVPTMITFFEPDAIVPVFIQLGCITGLTLGGPRSIDSTRSDDGWGNPPADIFSKITFGLTGVIGYGPVSVQYIHNVTGSMSKSFKRFWEENTGGVFSGSNAWSVTLAYTYWF